MYQRCAQSHELTLLVKGALAWIRELAKVTRVAICSGNHDNAGPQITADRAPVYEWLYELGKDPRIVSDGSTKVLGGYVG